MLACRGAKFSNFYIKLRQAGSLKAIAHACNYSPLMGCAKHVYYLPTSKHRLSQQPQKLFMKLISYGVCMYCW